MFLKSKLYQFGKYTWSQIDYLVSVEGYIPVASGTELNALRNAVSQTMGVGSRWAGTYTTGLDKKYIQVNHIDLSGFSNWVGIATFTGVYDGNGCNIDNLYINSTSVETGLFNVIDTPAVVQNIVVNGAYIRGTHNSNSLGVIAKALEGTTISNCVVNGGTFNSYRGGGGVGSLLGNSRATVSNCKALNILVECDGVGSLNYVGGFAGVIGSNSNTDNCYVTGVVNHPTGAYTRGTGGFVGYINSAPVISNSYANVEVNGDSRVGGFVGWNIFDGVFTNCYSCGLVTGNSSLGGFCGVNAGAITNCYYDTETSGRSDTGKGLPRTTAQMKNGTASSYINPDGSIDDAEDPDNAMFTTWDDGIWNFRTNLKYPKIRKI